MKLGTVLLCKPFITLVSCNSLYITQRKRRECISIGKVRRSHLIQQSVRFRVHFRELPKCFIANEADLMAILEQDHGGARSGLEGGSMETLTGSARMTTWTVALPGVSRLTKGVRMLVPPSLAACSMPGSWIEFEVHHHNH